jgi:hypothetical protein
VISAETVTLSPAAGRTGKCVPLRITGAAVARGVSEQTARGRREKKRADIIVG